MQSQQIRWRKKKIRTFIGFLTSPPQSERNETRKGLQVGFRLFFITYTNIFVMSHMILTLYCQTTGVAVAQSIPLSCEPTATQFLSVWRTPGMDRTTKNTEPIQDLYY